MIDSRMQIMQVCGYCGNVQYLDNDHRATRNEGRSRQILGINMFCQKYSGVGIDNYNQTQVIIR